MATDAESAANSPREKRPRWYRLTPERFIGALLVAEILLWLADRCHWLAFRQGFAVLLSIALLALAILLFSLSYLFAILRRRQFQFGIRALLVLAVAVAIPFSWLAVEINEAKRQHAIAKNLELRFQFFTKQWAVPPDWLTSILGEHFFTTLDSFCSSICLDVFTDDDLRQCCELDGLTFVIINRSAVTDAGLENIGKLHRLQYLDLRDTVITDQGLKHLERLRSLKQLHLEGTNTTEAGVNALRAKLPQCTVTW
jgi:hypothetical protein